MHKVYIGSMALIIIAALVYLGYSGFTYYMTSLEERFYHPDYDLLKPSGILGHGLWIFGSLSMLIIMVIHVAVTIVFGYKWIFNPLVQKINLKNT